MIAFGSYQNKTKPLVMNGFIVPFANCFFSFVAGFAVWTVVGYLDKLNLLADGGTSSISLAFITYPTAIDTMAMPNLWAIILGMTLFSLGVDSTFCVIEAQVAIIHDTKVGKKFPKKCIALVLCLIGFLISMPFCFNFGFRLW